MSQLFESVMLALASIWANKLRSMLTLLGNIVAVSSIITVVALITGVNAAVTDAIVSDLGADSFTIQRMGITQNEDDFERMRNNPLVTVDDAHAVKRFATSRSASIMAQAQTQTRVAYRDEELETLQVQGVSEEYLDFATFDAERGRMITPTEIKRKRLVTLIGWGTADRLFKGADPLDKTDQDRRRAVHGGRRQQEEGLGVRPVDGRIRGDSARQLSEAVRRAPVAGADGQAARRGARDLRARRSARRVARRSRAASRRSRTTSASSRRIRCSASSSRRRPASRCCWSASSACRCWSAAS